MSYVSYSVASSKWGFFGGMTGVGVPDDVEVGVMMLEAGCWSVGLAGVGVGIVYIKYKLTLVKIKIVIFSLRNTAHDNTFCESKIC